MEGGGWRVEGGGWRVLGCSARAAGPGLQFKAVVGASQRAHAVSAATTASRSAPCSWGSTTPNLDLRVETESSPTAPAPTSGLIRRPITDATPPPLPPPPLADMSCRQARTRSSSCRLSALRWTPG